VERPRRRRCQGVLDALRGRAAAGRALIDSARRTLIELGMRQPCSRLDQFSRLVEMVAERSGGRRAVSAEAYNGFADGNLRGRPRPRPPHCWPESCPWQLDRDAKPTNYVAESEASRGPAEGVDRLAEQFGPQLLARGGVMTRPAGGRGGRALAERTDALGRHGDACLALGDSYWVSQATPRERVPPPSERSNCTN